MNTVHYTPEEVVLAAEQIVNDASSRYPDFWAHAETANRFMAQIAAGVLPTPMANGVTFDFDRPTAKSSGTQIRPYLILTVAAAAIEHDNR